MALGPTDNMTGPQKGTQSITELGTRTMGKRITNNHERGAYIVISDEEFEMHVYEELIMEFDRDFPEWEERELPRSRFVSENDYGWAVIGECETLANDIASWEGFHS